MLLLITAFLGALNIFLCRFFIKRIASPAFFYWTAWLIGIACANLSAYWHILPPITPVGTRVILQSHVACFVGFLLASVIFGRHFNSDQALHWIERTDAETYGHAIKKVVVFLLLVAIAHLAYRLVRVGPGLFVSGNPLLQLRYSFLYEDIGLTRYFNGLESGLITVAALQGWMLAKSKRLDKVALWGLVAAVVIQNLALGGRQYILEVFLALIAGYFVARSSLEKQGKRGRILYVRVLGYVLILVILFTIIGNFKEGRAPFDLQARAGTAPAWVPSDALSYAAVPIAALGPITSNLRFTNRTYGGFTFEWVFDWLSRIGLVSRECVYSSAGDVFGREYIRRTDYRIGYTQGTAFAYMASDFGPDNVWLAAGIILAILQALFLVLLKRSALGFVAAVLCCTAAFMTIQFSEFLTGTFVFALLYAAVIAWMVKSHQKHQISSEMGNVSGPILS